MEQRLLQIDGVHAACVLSEKDEQGRNILFAHVATDPAQNYSSAHLRELMLNSVPSYMVPTVFLTHGSFPQLPNGKRDRASLRRLQKGHQHTLSSTDNPGDGASSRRTPGERAIITIFEQVTGLKVTSTGQSFVDIGIDSLNYIQAMLRLEPITSELPLNWPNLPTKSLVQFFNKQNEVGRNSDNAVLRPFILVNAEILIFLRAFSILAFVALHLVVGSIGVREHLSSYMISGYSIYMFHIPKVYCPQDLYEEC